MIDINLEKPLFSFLLFTYNQEKYVREAVLGALSQTYSPLEIIISDDCSTDSTWQIIQQTVRDYNGPHKISLNRNHRNLGFSDHINHAVKLTKGKWIVVAAGDDISYPNRVDMAYEAIEGRDDIFYIGTGVSLIDEKGRSCGNAGIDFENVIQLPGCMAVYHRDCFEQFDDLCSGVICEDLVLTFRALLLGKIILIDSPSVRYRTLTIDYYKSYKKCFKYVSAIKYSYRQRIRDIEKNCSPHSIDLLEQMKSVNDKFLSSSGLTLDKRKRIIDFYEADIGRRISLVFTMNELNFFKRMKMFVQSSSTVRRLRSWLEKLFRKSLNGTFTGKTATFELTDIVEERVLIQCFNCM